MVLHIVIYVDHARKTGDKWPDTNKKARVDHVCFKRAVSTLQENVIKKKLKIHLWNQQSTKCRSGDVLSPLTSIDLHTHDGLSLPVI